MSLLETKELKLKSRQLSFNQALYLATTSLWPAHKRSQINFSEWNKSGSLATEEGMSSSYSFICSLFTKELIQN